MLTGLWMPAAIGGAAGGILGWTAETYGATPLALVGALALAASGASVGALLPTTARLRGALVVGALVLAAGSPGLAQALPSPHWLPVDAPTWIGGAATLCTGFALGACLVAPGARRSIGGWPVGAAGVWLGVGSPLLAGGIAALLALLHERLPSLRQDQPDHRPSPGPGTALLWGAAVACAVAGWSAVRGSLDPTPGGAAVALAAFALLAGAGRALRRALGARFTRVGDGLPLAFAGLALLLLLGAWPERSWQALGDWAGRADPRPVLWGGVALAVAPGALTGGWCLGGVRITPSGQAALWLAAALGLLVGLDLGPDLRTAALAVATLVGLGAMWRPPLARRLGGLVALGGALAVLGLPVPFPEARLPEGRAAHLQDPLGPDRHSARVAASEPVAAGWGPGGSVVLLRRPDGSLLHVADGLPLEHQGRLAASERLAGLLARALAPRFDRALVLGDTQGHVTGGLVQVLVERTTVAVPHAEALRAQARVDSELSAVFLHPTVALVRGANEQVVRQAGPQDIVVEVARTPWQDGLQGLPGPRQLAARRELLTSRQGLYLLVADTTRLDEPALRDLIADMLAVFPHTWAFLPPTGADQVLLAGWVGEARANWDQFLAVETIALDRLSALGLGSALDLADRAAVGPEGLSALAGSAGRAQRVWLPSDLHTGPFLSLELLEPHLEGPEAWLDTGPLTQVQDILSARVETKRRALRLLGRAVRGDTEGVFTESRELLASSDGEQALDPILAPYLDRARDLLREARAQGLGSRRWGEALGELEAARLLNPRSTEVLALLADTHLALGNVPRAEETYAVVLELDPGHLGALLGSAQAALLMERFDEAERLLREAAQRNVRTWVAHHNLGEFLANAHRYDEAEKHLKLAIDLGDARQAAPHAALSTVYLERGDIAASLLQANRALALSDTAEHRYLVARAHYELDNLGIGLSHAQKGALRDPNHLGSHFIVGLIQGQRGQHGQCVRTFKRVLELQPGNEPAIQNLRRCQAAVEAAAVDEPG